MMEAHIRYSDAAQTPPDLPVELGQVRGCFIDWAFVDISDPPGSPALVEGDATPAAPFSGETAA